MSNHLMVLTPDARNNDAFATLIHTALANAKSLIPFEISCIYLFWLLLLLLFVSIYSLSIRAPGEVATRILNHFVWCAQCACIHHVFIWRLRSIFESRTLLCFSFIQFFVSVFSFVVAAALALMLLWLLLELASFYLFPLQISLHSISMKQKTIKQSC